MKKLFALLFALCLMATLLCVTALAADAPAEQPVMRVSFRTWDGGKAYPDTPDHTDFVTGWNYAISLAENYDMLDENGYHRVVVDLYADWTATNGEFGSGDGFNNDTVQFPSETCITLNMNGHTVNRGLTEYQRNGEVFYIGADAAVIINNGTVKGGFSCNGAGGIHIDDGANVVLNNVNVVGNKVEDDDGAGIALYDDANLVMNGGSISNNMAISASENPYGVAIYANDSYVTLDSVVIENNQCSGYAMEGLAVYAENSDVTMNRCTVKNNGIRKKDDSTLAPRSVIYCDRKSTLTMTGCGFQENSTHWPVDLAITASPDFGGNSTFTPTTLLRLNGATATVTDCAFNFNHAMYLISCNNATLQMSGGNVELNQSSVFRGYCKQGAGSYIANVTFSNNTSKNVIFYFTYENDLTFDGCNFGNASFNDKSRAKFGTDTSASMRGEGTLTAVLAIVALAAAGASIVFSVIVYKKRPVTAAPKEESEE